MSTREEHQKQIEALEDEITSLSREADDLKKQVAGLIQREAAGEGPFAGEIFRLGQRRQMLHTEIQHRRVKINHLLLGV
jgi:hypothetical protein